MGEFGKVEWGMGCFCRFKPHLICNEKGFDESLGQVIQRRQAIIVTANDELTDIAQMEYFRHRCFDNFIVNTLGAIAAYGVFSKKLCIRIQRAWDKSLLYSKFGPTIFIIDQNTSNSR